MAAAFSKILLTDAQLGDDSTVTVDILLCQVVQQVAALTDHHQQAAAGVVVVLVYTQVLGQLVDAGGEDGDLDFGRTGVALVGSILQDDLGTSFPSGSLCFPPFHKFPVS